VGRWRDAVLRHVQQHPLPADGSYDIDALADLSTWNPFAAYGTTLLAAAMTPESLLLLQLGDGDILTVTGEGVVDRPLPDDPRLAGNATTSLGARDAAGDFRSAAIPLTEAGPALVMLSTDGYGNSFEVDAGFRQVGSDLLAMIRAEGSEAVQANMEGWLESASARGSGDDVTLAILCRCGLER